jgi:hypothetical protein
MRRLKRRVRDLETRFRSGSVILYFSDVGTQELLGERRFLGRLYAAAYRGAPRTSRQVEQLELIRRAVRADEPGGGHMVELIQAVLAAGDVDPTLNAELDAIR